MATDPDIPETSPAGRIFMADHPPRDERERASERLEDPPTPDPRSPAALVFDRTPSTSTTVAAAVVCSLILHGGVAFVATMTTDSETRGESSSSNEPLDIRHTVSLDENQPPDSSPEEPADQAEAEPQPDPPEPPEPQSTSSSREPEPSSEAEPANESPPSEPSGEDADPSDDSKESSSTPAASSAGDVVDAESDSEVADFTESSDGDGSYAGGVTASSGTSDEAVRDPEASGGGDGERAAAPSDDAGQSVGLDRSTWDCEWPEQARDLSVDEQHVVLRAVVHPDGTAESVSIASDPGHGFGEAARDCALDHRFRPARDDDGTPRTATSPPIRVTFTR